MNLTKTILDILVRKGEVKSADIIKITGFSRAYINRFFKRLRNEGRIVLLGKANEARYIPATESSLKKAKQAITKVHRILYNKGLAENDVLADIKKRTGIFLGMRRNISNILDYAFLEMLNNAIEHSRSTMIEINMEKGENNTVFKVIDKGVGIFNNIMKKKNLKDHTEAIQDLLKGKQTTTPKTHSGEGIFFTSKAGTIFSIESSNSRVIFNNLIEDIFIEDTKYTKGTKILFSIALDSDKNLHNIFKQYTDESFKFSKTHVKVKLYKIDTEYISRSQARRVLTGLEKFKTISLDFQNVKTIGQGFADEVLRVWGQKHPDAKIIIKNANKNVQFMINHVSAME